MMSLALAHILYRPIKCTFNSEKQPDAHATTA